MIKQWQIPCLRGVIGSWVYYSALMNAEQLARRVIISKNIREEKSLNDFLQRKLNDRVKKIATYLKYRNDRFFNSVIIGVFDTLPQWIQFDLSDTAEKLGISDVKSLEDSLGLLVFNGEEKMFAIDGQHRVEGIKIAHGSNSAVKDDQYSVLLVAHVDNKEGKVRTRRLFSDINKRAVPVSNGDKVIIDEDEVTAIVARRIDAEYKHFKHGKLIVKTEREKLSEDDKEHFTNLLTLYAVNKRLKKLFKKVRGLPEYAPENVSSFLEIVTQFYDFVIEHEPSYRKFFLEEKTTIAKQRENNRNVLFRPIGLQMLSALYSYFATAHRLDRLSANLQKINFTSPGGYFDGILWNRGKVEAKSANRTAAYELCLHLLGETDKAEQEELAEKIQTILKRPSYKLPKPLI